MSSPKLKLRPLTAGPIVGHTTSSTTRLWGRGAFERGTLDVRRCHGFVRVLLNDTLVAHGSFPMRAHFDFTGIFDVAGLAPATRYTFQMGYLLAELEPEQLPTEAQLDFSECSPGSFRTSPAAETAAAPLSFVFGSCRYLLRLFGGAVFDDRGDKTFRSILQQIDSGRSTDLLLMLGDQIYADDLKWFRADDEASEYHARYREAFTTPNLRRLMACTPTYMAMDDHEIQDNWTQDRYGKQHQLYNVAMAAFASYQQVHGPSFQPEAEDTLSDTPAHRYYSFRHGSADFFIMDVRTERFKEFKPPEMISRGQMQDLKNWLKQSAAQVRFIGSSVPFFPDHRSDNDDKWSGFASQRNEILDFIRREQVRGVVFLSGDVHCSFWSTLSHPADPQFRIHQIVSSAFYWPYPAESRGHFTTTGVLAHSDDYRVSCAPIFHNEDNFTRVSLVAQSIEVEVFDRKGKRLAGPKQLIL